MEKTPSGTSVGVDDPYVFAGRCDHATGDGRCRFAVERAERDPTFARERRSEGYACPVVAADLAGSAINGRPETDEESERTDGRVWRECPHYRSRTRGRCCVRCGLEERRTTLAGERPLLEEHHLSYADPPDPPEPLDPPEPPDPPEPLDPSEPVESGSTDSSDSSHEITVSLCRWCHAKIHRSWARVSDDASPDPDAIATREGRRSHEIAQSAFETAAKRRKRSE